MKFFHPISRLISSPWLWIGLGAVSFLVRSLLVSKPEWVERWYSRWLFPGIRSILDYTIGLFPVPWIYLITLLILVLLVRSFFPLGQGNLSWPQRLSTTGLRFLAVLGGSYFFFLFLWGYNYIRQPLEVQLAFDMTPLSEEELWQNLEEETHILVQLRTDIPSVDMDSIAPTLDRAQTETALRDGVGRWLQENGFPAPGRVRGRLLYPKGGFLRFSSAGMYFPFSGEGYVDAGLHSLQIAPVMAHELGHGFGFGDEGTCNFLAYVGCLNTDDPYLRYAGQLNYWRTLAVNCRRYDPDRYRAFRASLPDGIQHDLNTINRYLLKYPDLMPKVRHAAYSSYLKAQGIEEGIANYNRVLMLVKAWKQTRRS